MNTPKREGQPFGKAPEMQAPGPQAALTPDPSDAPGRILINWVILLVTLAVVLVGGSYLF